MGARQLRVRTQVSAGVQRCRGHHIVGGEANLLSCQNSELIIRLCRISIRKHLTVVCVVFVCRTIRSGLHLAGFPGNDHIVVHLFDRCSNYQLYDPILVQFYTLTIVHWLLNI